MQEIIGLTILIINSFCTFSREQITSAQDIQQDSAVAEHDQENPRVDNLENGERILRVR